MSDDHTTLDGLREDVTRISDQFRALTAQIQAAGKANDRITCEMLDFLRYLRDRMVLAMLLLDDGKPETAKQVIATDVSAVRKLVGDGVYQ